MTQRLAYDFRAGGNGAPLLRGGWHGQETSGTWSAGEASHLALPPVPEGVVYRLALHLVGFVAPPALPRQRLLLLLNGQEILQAEVTHDALWDVRCTLPANLLRSDAENILTLLHPDSHAPVGILPGNPDARSLAVRLLDLFVEVLADPRAEPPRRVVILTMAYNEAVNLPIWLRHYRRSAPQAELLVIDHGSDDGSTDDLGGAGRLRLARIDHDEVRRAAFVNELQRSLLRYYDIVIYTDCDELLVPDPTRYIGLGDYLQRFAATHANAVGLNLVHVPEREPALDPARPLLRQRRYVQFAPPLCKPLVTTVPVTWSIGFHACEWTPRIDPELFLFHLKAADWHLALLRHHANRALRWSPATLSDGLSAHQRLDDARFQEVFFGETAAVVARGEVKPFDFREDIARYMTENEASGGTRPGHPFSGRVAEIPSDFAGLF